MKKFFLKLMYRLKPRLEFRWIFTFCLWLLVIVYMSFGVYFAREVYSRHSESRSAVFSTKIYPFPAAFVGGNIIWAKDYYKQLSYIRRFSETTNKPAPEATALRTQIIDQLIENRLLEWEASKNGIRVSKAEVNGAFQKAVEQSGGLANVQKTLRELWNMSEGDFKDLIAAQVAKEKIQDQIIAQVKVLHILIKDEAKANDVAARAKKGEPWDQLAKNYSEDIKTRDNWGDLGWIARGNLVVDNQPVPEFEDAAFQAKTGEIFGPVKTKTGFEIGKIEDKKGKIDLSYTNWLSNIKKGTKIYTFIK